jgi:DNA-binding NarL/FixJ family response regulator
MRKLWGTWSERVVVSARTIEGNISRACIKLDVSDREELAAVIRKDTNK